MFAEQRLLRNLIYCIAAQGQARFVRDWLYIPHTPKYARSWALDDQRVWKASALRHLVEATTQWQGLEDSLQFFLDTSKFNCSLEKNSLRFTPLKASAVHLYKYLTRPATKPVPESLRRAFIGTVGWWLRPSLERRRITAELWLLSLSPRAQPYYDFLQECHREGNFRESAIASGLTGSEHRHLFYKAVTCAQLLHAGGDRPKALQVLQMARQIAPSEFLPRKGPIPTPQVKLRARGHSPQLYNPERMSQFQENHGKFAGLRHAFQ